MQRILQPGEIETIDRTHFARILLPNPASIFAERAARVRQLAEGNPIADYLHFMAKIIDAQHAAAATLSTAPLAAARPVQQEAVVTAGCSRAGAGARALDAAAAGAGAH